MNRLFTLLVLILVPAWAGAVDDLQWGYARDISQRWVEEHNKILKDIVTKAVPLGAKETKELTVASKGLLELPMKKLDTDNAGDYGIPSEVINAKGVTVELMKLDRTDVGYTAGGARDFITADYYDELDPTHSVSDIYFHIGFKYFHLFHGEGYPHSIRLFFLDQTEAPSPLFFEVGQYGGGSRVDKVIYTLDAGKVASIPQQLLDRPDHIYMKDFIQKKLAWSVWLSGQTLYRDLSKDDHLEIVQVTRVGYPDDLRADLGKKYGFENVDFSKPFRKALTVYQWNETKQRFDDLGEYYY